MSQEIDQETKFIALTGELTYTGEGGSFQTGDGDFTLNGEPMDKQTTYYLKDGDIIDDLGFKSPTPEDLRWKFN